MSKQEDFTKYIYDSLVRIEKKIESFDDKFATKKESNIKALILTLMILLVHGIILPEDVLRIIGFS